MTHPLLRQSLLFLCCFVLPPFWIIAANYARKLLWHSQAPFALPNYLSLSLYPFIPCYSFACSVLAYPNPVSPLMSTLAFRFMLRASLRFLLLKRNASPKLITEDIPIYIWTYIYRCVCVAARATCRISFASPTGSQGDVEVRATCAHLPLLPLDINQMARGCIKTRCSRGISVLSTPCTLPSYRLCFFFCTH